MNKKYQVFVSSTYSDLKAERQACVEAILTAGHIPAGMELFAAGNETQLEIIKRWIDESDIYMLLLGGRYGSIEPQSGWSYTELEYRYALEKGKPMFAIVMDEAVLNEKIKTQGKSYQEVLELTNQQKLFDFKELVLSKICKFFRNEDQLKLAINQSIHDILNKTTLVGWVRANEFGDSINNKHRIISLELENSKLQGELKVLNENFKYLFKSNNHDNLSKEAKMLLTEISQDNDGSMCRMKLGTTQWLETNRKKFGFNVAPRESALWENAVKKLEDQGLINVRMTGRDITTYAMTNSGFEIADKLTKEG